MPFQRLREDKEAIEFNDELTVRNIQVNLERLNNKIVNSLNESVLDLDKKCKQARNLKWEAIENMADLLELFEENWLSNQQGHIKRNKLIWANNDQEARRSIDGIIRNRKPKKAITLSGAELTELEISELLKTYKLTEFCANWEHQFAHFLGEQKFHPCFPLIHKNLEDLNDALEKVEGNEISPFEYWLAEHRSQLNEFKKKETILFINAHFICPDLGGIAYIDNDGTLGQTLEHADTVVILAGIDRVLASSDDISPIANLMNTFNGGEYIAPQLRLIMGSTRKNQEVSIILVDNARTELLKHQQWRTLLYDLDGICWLNQCHDYPYISPSNYHPFHFGPISALLSILLYDDPGFMSNHLFWADAQDGLLEHPLKVNFKELLISLRHEILNDGQEKYDTFHNYWKAHEKAEKDSTGFKKWQLKRKLKAVLGKERKLPDLAKVTFLEEWQVHINRAKKM